LDGAGAVLGEQQGVGTRLRHPGDAAHVGAVVRRRFTWAARCLGRGTCGDDRVAVPRRAAASLGVCDLGGPEEDEPQDTAQHESHHVLLLSFTGPRPAVAVCDERYAHYSLLASPKRAAVPTSRNKKAKGAPQCPYFY